MEALTDFLGVACVVELQEAGEDFSAGGFADRVADALLSLVEAVAEVEVGPAVGGGDGPVQLDVEVTKLFGCRRRLRRERGSGCRSWSAPPHGSALRMTDDLC